jgi:hypothetical protein
MSVQSVDDSGVGCDVCQSSAARNLGRRGWQTEYLLTQRRHAHRHGRLERSSGSNLLLADLLRGSCFRRIVRESSISQALGDDFQDNIFADGMLNRLLNGFLDDHGGDVFNISFAGFGNGVENGLGNYLLIDADGHSVGDGIRYLVAQLLERGYASLADHVFC